MSYSDDLKYEHFVSDMDEQFPTARSINFDIIHHQCRGDELKNPIKHYKLIQEKDFINYKKEVKDAPIASTMESERQNIHIEKKLVEKSLLSNSFRLKRSKETKKTDDCKCFTFQFFRKMDQFCPTLS